jgi:tryptophan synthase alpha chain
VALNQLQAHLEARRADGSKSLVAYVTAGLTPDWLDSIGVLSEAGADVIEVGLPFSDPMLDGPVIQRASFQALQNGMTPLRALEMLRGLDVGVPLVAMSYANPVTLHGEAAFCAALAEAGLSGLIVPDLTGAAAGELAHHAAVHDVDLVPCTSSAPWHRRASSAGMATGALKCAEGYATSSTCRSSSASGSPVPPRPRRPARTPTGWWSHHPWSS